MTTRNFEACIPLPLQICIDDVGWRNGRDGSRENQPFRTGIHRDHVADDYRAIVRLGRALGMRPQCQLVLGEWDTDNLLRKVPTASWEGENWDNRPRLGPWVEEAGEILRTSGEYLELCLHGLQHEYWLDGVGTRAEFADMAGVMRPREQVIAHLDTFYAIFDRHRLGPRPTDMVPPAGRHMINPPEGAESFAEVLDGYGIRGIFTPFAFTPQGRKPEYEWFGFDHGLITVDRWNDLFDWFVIGRAPDRAPVGPVCSMHWPNILHPDPSRNAEIVDGWVNVLRPIDESFERMLSPNTDAFCAQLVHHGVTRVERSDGMVTVDASAYFRQPWKRTGADPITLKLRSQHGVKVGRAGRQLPITTLDADTTGVIQSVQVGVNATEPVATLQVVPLSN